MRYILLVLLAFVTTFASAQVQYLGSPTTTVRNRGNFVSDSLFYLPKRTKAPSDTGALRYQISDSALYVWTGSAWRSTGTAGSAITGSGVAGYMPEFTTSTNLDTTRLYHSAGRFAIGSTTTTNGVFNVYGGRTYFDSTITVNAHIATINLSDKTNSQNNKIETQDNRFVFSVDTSNAVADSRMIFAVDNSISMYLNSQEELIINADNEDRGDFKLQVILGSARIDNDIEVQANARLAQASGAVSIGTTSTTGALNVSKSSVNTVFDSKSATDARIEYHRAGSRRSLFNWDSNVAGFQQESGVNFYISGTETLIGTQTDAGAYALQVAGAIYNTTGGQLAASSGNVQFGTNQSYIYNSYDSIAALFQRVGTFGPVIRLGRQGVANQASLDVPVDGFFAITTAGSERLRIQNNGEVLIGTTTDAGVYALQVTGAIYNTTTITTGEPTGGSIKPWRLGEAATVSPTSPNRTIRVEIDGTVYFIHAKTTND